MLVCLYAQKSESMICACVCVHVCDVYVNVCDVYVHVQLVQMEVRISLHKTMYTHHPLAVDTTPVRWSCLHYWNFLHLESHMLAGGQVVLLVKTWSLTSHQCRH